VTGFPWTDYLPSSIISAFESTLAEMHPTSTSSPQPTTTIQPAFIPPVKSTTQTPTTPTTVPTPSTSSTTSVSRLESNDEVTSSADNPGVASSTGTPAQIHAVASSTSTINPTTGAPGFTVKPTLSATFQATDVTGSTPTVSPSSSSHHSNASAVVGGVVGGLIFLVFLVVVFLFYLRKRKRNRTAPSAEFRGFFKRHGSLLSKYRFKRNSQRSSMFNSLASDAGDSPISEKGDDEDDDFETDRLSAQTRVTYGLAV